MLLRERLGAKMLEMRDELLGLRHQPARIEHAARDAALHAFDERDVLAAARFALPEEEVTD